MLFKYAFLVLAATVLMQPVFADDMNSNSKECKMIVKACMKSGYTQRGKTGKQFWMDCMKPVLMGKTVAKVTVSADAVKACRDQKIADMTQELNDLKSVQ